MTTPPPDDDKVWGNSHNDDAPFLLPFAYNTQTQMDDNGDAPTK